MRKNHLDSGFTLVEVVVTLAILGIIAMVAVPNIKTWQESYTLRSASQEVYAMLMQAKTEAMKRNRNCRVEFGKNGATGIQICTGATVSCAAATTFKQSQLPTGATFTGGGGDGCPSLGAGGAFAFRANFLPVNPQFTCGSVYVTVGGQTSRVNINNAGNITIF